MSLVSEMESRRSPNGRHRVEFDLADLEAFRIFKRAVAARHLARANAKLPIASPVAKEAAHRQLRNAEAALVKATDDLIANFEAGVEP